MADDGTHNYMWENDSIREATPAEHAEEFAGFPIPAPSDMDILESQVMWTAMMTDTLL